MWYYDLSIVLCLGGYYIDNVTDLDGRRTIAEEIASEGFVLIANEGESGSGANTGCVMYSGIPSKGNSGLNIRLRIEIENGREKNMYILTWA